MPKFTLKRDLVDHRDHQIRFRDHHLAAPLPSKVDLRPYECYPIFSQGFIGSCTAHAIAAAFHFSMIRQGLEAFAPSRLFIYFNERVFEGTENSDAGASLRTGITTCLKIGVCDEKLWPYSQWHFKQRPADTCYQQALHHRAVQYARVDQTVDSMRRCLGMGIPFVFGFTVYSSFAIGPCMFTGTMDMPLPFDVPLGGHAVMACGYDDELEAILVRNSWSHYWGDGGYFHMPYAFVTNPKYCSDFWAINWVEGSDFPSDRPSEPTSRGCASACKGSP